LPWGDLKEFGVTHGSTEGDPRKFGVDRTVWELAAKKRDTVC